MSDSPRVVLSMVQYNRADRLAESIESLLSQTYRDFRLLLVDDCSGDETPEISRRYAALDRRVEYLPNATRRAMIGNWRHAVELAKRKYPQAVYFGWASDHDLWHPRWLELAVEVLDAHPEAVLAYPQRARLSETGELSVFSSWRFDSVGESDPRRRLLRTIEGMSAGSMMYGLFRASAVGADLLHHVYLPDRLFLGKLAIAGQFAQVPHFLYYRRPAPEVSLRRQASGMFPGLKGKPAYFALPFWLVHSAVLLRDLAWRGAGQPSVSRRAGVILAALYAWASLRQESGRILWWAVDSIVTSKRLRTMLKDRRGQPLAPGRRVANLYRRYRSRSRPVSSARST